MGEIIAVLNGIEFRTRHNDYKLKMASTTSTDYHAILLHSQRWIELKERIQNFQT